MQPCFQRAKYNAFSVFQRLLPCSRIQSRQRQYHATTSLFLADRKTHSHDGPNILKINSRVHSRKRQRDRPRSETSKPAKDAAHEERFETEVVPGKVRKVLGAINALLTDKHNGDGSKQDYFASVVTDVKQWKRFEDSLKDLWETQRTPDNQASNNAKSPLGLFERIKKDARRSTWFQDISRTLKFAYMDHILQVNQIGTNSQDSNAIDLRYPNEWYTETRFLQRQIHLHVGPTNSGKTYNALKRLEASRDGFYAGPLRLLAHEVYSRFNNRGIGCELITGDDVRLNDEKCDMYCSTVEMVDIGRNCDVGVVDEIQMIGDSDRGWAWTRALLGAKAKELHLCGEARVVPLVRELVASMGDTLHLHQYERLNPLKVMSQSLKGNLKNLRKGDCVVSFSVMNIHALKRQIELETGRRVAIVYGSLPPETRAQQAALFNDPDNDYDFLVASDAVGMGLNLTIKRVIFERTHRYDGSVFVQLSIPQIKQIAGRAGRFRTSNDDKRRVDAQKPESKQPINVGLVTCLDDRDLPVIQRAIKTEAPPIRQAGLLPPGEVYEQIGRAWPEGTPFEYILSRVHQIVSLNTRFNLCDTRDQLLIARAIEDVSDLTIRERLLLCAAPASMNSRHGGAESVIVALAKTIADRNPATICDIPELPLEILNEPMNSSREYLEALEHLHKSLNLFLWLHYRFSTILIGKDMAVRAKELTEEKINSCLASYSANPRLRRRLEAIRTASALLQNSKSGNTQHEEDSATLNPDASVEEIERQAREEAELKDIDEFLNAEELNHTDPISRGQPPPGNDRIGRNQQGDPIMISEEQRFTTEAAKGSG